MRDNIQRKVFRFLDEQCQMGPPLLLALSGGPDSICLLHLLLEYRKERPLDLQLVHVDHGWREESAAESALLAKMAEELKLPFYGTRLDPETISGNLEEECRNARLNFFASVQKETKAQGVLLGHHADDQAETVLKRLFEGARLTNLSGMQEVAVMSDVRLFRPLLEVTKAEILDWLEKRGISFFDDVTNRDPKFLRARMRQEMLPFLERSFGKECSHHLTQLASEADLIKEHFRGLLAPIIEGGEKGPFGTMYDAGRRGLSLIECRYLIQLLSAKHRLSLSRAEDELGCACLVEKSANKWISPQLYVDRGRLFFIEQCKGSWKIEIKKAKVGAVQNGWRDVWRGKVSTLVAAGEYRAEMASLKMRVGYSGKQFDYYLTEKKVPRFVSTLCPVLTDGEMIVEDFLTGCPCAEGAGAVYFEGVFESMKYKV